MPLPRYAEHVVSAMVLTSVTTHLIISRRAAAEEKRKLEAQTSVLSDLVDRARRGSRISDTEYSRLLALVSLGNPSTLPPTPFPATDGEEHNRGATSWKEVLLGRKPSEKTREQLEEEARMEWEAALNSNPDEGTTSRQITSIKEETNFATPPSLSSAQQTAPSAIRRFL